MHGAALLGALGVTRPSFGQSLSIDEQAESAPERTPAPAPARPSPPARPAKVVLPTPVSTPVEYPEAGVGAADVAVELVLSAEGSVTAVELVAGEPPFAESALAAAKAWKFQPATRDGKPVAAKIRYMVRFVPPVGDAPAPELAARTPGGPASASPSAAPKPKPADPYEIVVVGARAPIRHELGRAEIRDMPGAFGDPYRAIEALPGVVPIVSGLPYFYVRGAPPGNVGYFFDGIPVPFLYHFAAGPGVLHPAFVERVDLYPGAYPVRYGRFAGAIVAGEMAPPGDRFGGEWSVRIIDSGAMAEGTFADGRGTIMLGGRYSYTGLVLSLISPEVSVGYWDYQARARYQLDADDSVELLAFGSADHVSNTEQYLVETRSGDFRQEERETTLVDVGFHRLDLRWDRRLDGGNWRNALMLGRDRTGIADGEISVTNYLVGARTELDQQLEKKFKLRAGADVLFESLAQELREGGGPRDSVSEGGVSEPGAPAPQPGVDVPPMGLPEPEAPISEEQSDEEPDFGFDRQRVDFTAGAWADLVWDAAPNVQVTPGLRLDVFVSGQRAALGVDPRITVEYKLNPKLSVVHGLGLVHQAPSFVVPVPGLKPSLAGGLQRSLQHSAGLSQGLPEGLSASFAVFQNAFFNMTDLISLVQLANTEGTPTDFRSTGHAYGAELMIRRSMARRLGGFISYTLSRSVRSAGRLEGPATTDRSHVLNVAASYDLGREWRFGSRFLLYSGIPAKVAYLEAAQAPPRTPPFWRIDAKLTKRWFLQRPHRWWGVVFEVLNTTLNKEQLEGSCNAFSCTYEEIGPVTIPSIGLEGAF